MKKNTDIGHIFNSKLENKYNDDFFDESKSWDSLFSKLPKKGFWDWGYSHFNIFYTSAVAILALSFAFAFYANFENKSASDNNNEVSINNNFNTQKTETVPQNSIDKVTRNYKPIYNNKNSQNDSVTPALSSSNIPIESSEKIEHTQPNQIDDFKPIEPKQETPQSTIIEQKIINKDSIKISKHAPKRDTIRQKIKRFD